MNDNEDDLIPRRRRNRLIVAFYIDYDSILILFTSIILIIFIAAMSWDISAKQATPLFIAAQNGHYRILIYLLAQGFEPDTRRTDGATPLWIAAQMGHDHIVAQLLKAGARVDAARHDGATPLFKASHKGHSAVVNELLKYSPSLGLLPNGESALHAAALVGCLPVCKQLVAAGADPNLRNQEGYMPADLAYNGRFIVVGDHLKNSVKRIK